MKNIPQKIYLQTGHENLVSDFKMLSLDDITWSSTRVNDTDIEYDLSNKSDNIIPVIAGRTFYLGNIRDLNAMVKSGHITSSKMVELLNETVKWEVANTGLGNTYLKDMIKDLKADSEAQIV